MDVWEKNILPWSIYKPYFFLEKHNITGNNYRVQCILCHPSIKMLSTSSCSASNLLRHLRKVHPEIVPKIRVMGPGHKKSSPVKQKKSTSLKCAIQESAQNLQIIKAETTNAGTVILQESFAEPIEQKEVKMELCFENDFNSQHKLDLLVVNFIINGLHPPQIVERNEFQSLITGLQPERTIMNRLTVENIISENAKNFKRQLKDILSQVPHVCITADGWKVMNKSYLGLSVQWIDPASLERRSAILGCRRICGAHTFPQIARIIQELQEEFAIQNKVAQIVTDNGLNFAKTCRVFGNDADNEEEVEIAEQDYEFVELHPIFKAECDLAVYNMPQYKRCVVHTMNLVATNDIQKAENDHLYRDSMRESLSRSQALWRMQNSSLQYVEFVKTKLGTLLVEPKDSCWRSQFAALKHLRTLFGNKMEALDYVCDGLEVPKFREVDKVFIDEYCKVMKPLAAALDALQSENNAYMGLLLPVLHALRRRLVHFRDQASNQDLLVVCYPLLEAVIEGLDKRFEAIMCRKDLVLASVLHPEFQLIWLKDAERENMATECLKEVVQEISTTCINSDYSDDENDDELFDFKKPMARNSAENKWQAEVEQYLSFSTGQLKCLDTYPLIKALFIQFNTAIPASAAVEKVFTVCGDIFTQRSGVLTNTCFEEMIMVKTGIS